MARRLTTNLKPSKGQAFWDHHISAWQQSDQPKVTYCRDHGLATSTFDNWRRKLQAVVHDRSMPGDFVTMAVRHRVSTSDVGSPGAIEIEFHQGIVVRLNAPIDRETLFNVLQLIRQLP